MLRVCRSKPESALARLTPRCRRQAAGCDGRHNAGDPQQSGGCSLSDEQQRLGALSSAVLAGLLRGIEKESLRIGPDGSLAQTPHPAALGSPLTHPHITTDFSESQLELITGVHTGAEACLEELTEIHQFVYRHIGDEMLWSCSMPCKLPADDRIPIGRYGSSNIGRAKTVYRIGLSHRYGRRMQTISGIHYNFSVPDAAWPVLQQAEARAGATRLSGRGLLRLIRNFRRHSWLLLYLFGASPAVCESFVAGRRHGLQKLRAGRCTCRRPRRCAWARSATRARRRRRSP